MNYTNCISCGCHVTESPLHRTKPVGQPDMGLMCMSCMEKNEPELAKNEKEDMSDIEKYLTKILYPSCGNQKQ